MNKSYIFLLFILAISPLLGCQKSNKFSSELDNNSYINDFQLIQKNQNNDNTLRITSPKAIIDPIDNDIEIIDSLIEIVNNNVNTVRVTSDSSIIENSLNLIKVFNNVNISFLEPKEYYIITDSFIWNLNTSNIDLDKPLDIIFDETRITSSSGDYNVDTGTLSINNNQLNRTIYNIDGKEQYRIVIKADVAKWYKSNNLLEFKSNNKQVETTVNFLGDK